MQKKDVDSGGELAKLTFFCYEKNKKMEAAMNPML